MAKCLFRTIVAIRSRRPGCPFRAISPALKSFGHPWCTCSQTFFLQVIDITLIVWIFMAILRKSRGPYHTLVWKLLRYDKGAFLQRVLYLVLSSATHCALKKFMFLIVSSLPCWKYHRGTSTRLPLNDFFFNLPMGTISLLLQILPVDISWEFLQTLTDIFYVHSVFFFLLSHCDRYIGQMWDLCV